MRTTSNDKEAIPVEQFHSIPMIPTRTRDITTISNNLYIDTNSWNSDNDSEPAAAETSIGAPRHGRSSTSAVEKTKEDISAPQPCPEDVLLGRGGTYQQHPGNVRYTELIQRHQSAYVRGDNATKKLIVYSIVSDIILSGGRFLKPNRAVVPQQQLPLLLSDRQPPHPESPLPLTTTTGCSWTAITKDAARLKVAHAMQYRQRRQYEYRPGSNHLFHHQRTMSDCYSSDAIDIVIHEQRPLSLRQLEKPPPPLPLSPPALPSTFPFGPNGNGMMMISNGLGGCGDGGFCGCGCCPPSSDEWLIPSSSSSPSSSRHESSEDFEPLQLVVVDQHRHHWNYDIGSCYNFSSSSISSSIQPYDWMAVNTGSRQSHPDDDVDVADCCYTNRQQHQQYEQRQEQHPNCTRSLEPMGLTEVNVNGNDIAFLRPHNSPHAEHPDQHHYHNHHHQTKDGIIGSDATVSLRDIVLEHNSTSSNPSNLVLLRSLSIGSFDLGTLEVEHE